MIAAKRILIILIHEKSKLERSILVKQYILKKHVVATKAQSYDWLYLKINIFKHI